MRRVIYFFLFVLVLTTCVLPGCGDGVQFGVVNEKPFDTARLVKVNLASGLDEPMEVGIADNGDVLIIERKGAIKKYFAASDSIRQIAELPVFSGLEDGLLGLALDPGFKTNGFIYLFYSPPGDKPMQRVSRFTMKNDSLLFSSEKVLLEIPTQREECCHSAGSLAFGPEGNLFIAVGDNTNPHNPGYYNSIDERKGREYWDAQRTAGNTNDFRGKILRIHPEPDGTYTIPEGNLFAPGTPQTKPEIYVMGCRNPYRISVDPKKGWLYWGDVGQNTIDNPSRGPISYDEWHLATEAGFFGWPYFAGPNAPYADFDFATEKIGPFFDPEKPENNSPNNTGLKQLPPAKGALIWYSYDESKIFPHLGTGGKSPVAGPVFYTDLYKDRINDTTRHLHEYFNGKVFIAEWLRDWVNVLTVNEQGKLDSIEPFMRGTTFSHPIELEIGPDGMLYVLEYGPNWFSKNKEAGLYRIEYHRSGDKPALTKTVADSAKNAAPEISVEIQGNRSFFWPNIPVEYSVEVRDREDGSLAQGTIAETDVQVTLSQTTMGTDMAVVATSHRAVTAPQPDFAPINESDCKACHAMNAKSVGPSYIDIAERYKKDPATVSRLAQKIINGGSGSWGNTHAMSAHPQLSQEDAQKMVDYILGLRNDMERARIMPAKGRFVPELRRNEKGTAYVLYATYHDKGAGEAASNTAQQVVALRAPEIAAASADESEGVEKSEGGKVTLTGNSSWIKFNQLDLSGIRAISFKLDAVAGNGKITLHTGVAVGAEVGTVTVTGKSGSTVTMTLKSDVGTGDVYFVYNGDGQASVESLRFSR